MRSSHCCRNDLAVRSYSFTSNAHPRVLEELGSAGEQTGEAARGRRAEAAAAAAAKL